MSAFGSATDPNGMTDTTGLTDTVTTTVTGPAAPTREAAVRLRPIGLGDVAITGGFWSTRQTINAAGAIPAGHVQLEAAGNLRNLRIAAGLEQGDATGPVFADSDVYKWLEAVAWECARQPSERLLELQREVTATVAAAQQDDGYLDSVVQLRFGRAGRYQNLPWSHENYCAGHLIQAAVAQVRCTGDRGLLDVAIRLADHLVATFGENLRHDVDGHPVIETALVELYRETGTDAYLELARYFVDARGHGLMAKYGKEPTYFSDRVPVREATTVEGHAVRAVYLAAGATDVATELHDAVLLESVQRQFEHMMATKAYLTGGLGARWEGEAFGDPFELPTDRGYGETCATIGGIQWAWRLLLATGDAQYGDAIERMLYNGFLAGVSLTGTEYFYVNPLRLRGDAHPDENRSPAHGRRGWFDCACCPPNIMRMLASLDGFLATRSESGVQLHQFATGTVTAPAPDGSNMTLEVTTEYPWEGAIAIRVAETGDAPWTLSVRIPQWAAGASILVAGEAFSAEPGSYAEITRSWSAGDMVTVTLPTNVRTVVADQRIDAVRGCVAFERGPLVYALEQVDNVAAVDDVSVDTDAVALAKHVGSLLGGVTTLRVNGFVSPEPMASLWPYPPADDSVTTSAPEPATLTLIPYFAWANREVGAMRVWIPQV